MFALASLISHLHLLSSAEWSTLVLFQVPPEENWLASDHFHYLFKPGQYSSLYTKTPQLKARASGEHRSTFDRQKAPTFHVHVKIASVYVFDFFSNNRSELELWGRRTHPKLAILFGSRENWQLPFLPLASVPQLSTLNKPSALLPKTTRFGLLQRLIQRKGYVSDKWNLRSAPFKYSFNSVPFR